MDETEKDSKSKKRKRDTIKHIELEAAAKDPDLLQTLDHLNVSDDEFGIPVHKIQNVMQRRLAKDDPPPRSSVYKGLRRLKSAKLVREKVKRIPPEEVSQHRGWRVKRNKDTKKPEIGENGKVEVQYGFELTPRGETVAKFLEEHLEPSESKKERDKGPEDESGDK